MVSQEDIQQLIEGNERAFRKVYDALSGKVYQLAFRFLKDESPSEEIVQEAFLRLWLNRSFLDNKGNLWLYLYVIAKRLCLNKLREIRKSQVMLDELMGRIDILNNSFYQPELKEMELVIDNAVSHLPKQQQVIFNLSRQEGLSHKEIAQKLRLSPNTVKNHMVQALKTLKNTMQEYGYSYVLFVTYTFIVF